MNDSCSPRKLDPGVIHVHQAQERVARLGADHQLDDETTQVRFNFTVRKFDDERTTSSVAGAFVGEINKQIQEDQPIWEHKAFLPTPALADTIEAALVRAYQNNPQLNAQRSQVRVTDENVPLPDVLATDLFAAFLRAFHLRPGPGTPLVPLEP